MAVESAENLPDAVKSAVAFDPLGKLQRIAGFTRVCHDEMVAEHLLLVHVGLHLDDRTGCIRVGCDDGVALAGDAERALHFYLFILERSQERRAESARDVVEAE